MVRAALLLAGLAACGGGGGAPPERLSGWELFLGNGSTQEPAAGVVPYEVISSLFQDLAGKHRFISVPEGEIITYDDGGIWGFPDGTVLVKSFALGGRLIETRLLVREAGAWTPLAYQWNDAQTDAARIVAGARVPIDGMPSFIYRIPNENQCRGCHAGEDGEVELLGPRTRQLDRDNDYGAGPVNQIDHLASLGLFDRAPPAATERESLSDPFGSDPLDRRARSYLDANCAHCHRPGGSAGSTGLFLAFEMEEPGEIGICRSPVAAGAGTGGRSYDVVPGRPDESILLFRMESDDPEIKMPELPAVLPDTAGAALVRDWIGAMPATGCP